MKLEVGMYCRYNNFQNKIKIAKIKGIQKNEIDNILYVRLSPDIYCLVHNKLVKLQQENQQLKEDYKCMKKQRDDLTKNATEQITSLLDNWNKLKEWLEELIKESGLEGIIQASIFNHVLEKMQEIEGGNNE